MDVSYEPGRDGPDGPWLTFFTGRYDRDGRFRKAGPAGEVKVRWQDVVLGTVELPFGPGADKQG